MRTPRSQIFAPTCHELPAAQGDQAKEHGSRQGARQNRNALAEILLSRHSEGTSGPPFLALLVEPHPAFRLYASRFNDGVCVPQPVSEGVVVRDRFLSLEN